MDHTEELPMPPTPEPGPEPAAAEDTSSLSDPEVYQTVPLGDDGDDTLPQPPRRVYLVSKSTRARVKTRKAQRRRELREDARFALGLVAVLVAIWLVASQLKFDFTICTHPHEHHHEHHHADL